MKRYGVSLTVVLFFGTVCYGVGCYCARPTRPTKDISQKPTAKSLNQWHWHTTPDKWKEPRVFHTPFGKRYDAKILIWRKPLNEAFKCKVYSPNKAYWYGGNVEDTDEPTFFLNASDNPVYVFNERNYVIQILFDDAQAWANVFWINEKLLSIRARWGHVLGTDLIFDVEQEKFVYREMWHGGTIAFQQWQQAKQADQPQD